MTCCNCLSHLIEQSHMIVHHRGARNPATDLLSFGSWVLIALTTDSILTLLKADTMSLPRSETCWPSACALFAFEMISIIVSIADRWWRLPNCSGWNSGSRWIRLAVTFSTSLPLVLLRPIGL